MRKVFAPLSVVLVLAASHAALRPAAAQEQSQQAVTEVSPAGAEQATVLDVINGSAEYSTFANLLQRSGLAQMLTSKGPFTVFVPTNASFASLPAGTVEQLLLPQNKGQLAELVSDHILPGAITSNEWGANPHLGIALGGASLVYTGGQHERINNAPVVTKDIHTANGIVHVVNAPLIRPQAN